MKKLLIAVLFAFVAALVTSFAAQINSTNYRQSVVVSSGGDNNLSSPSYKMGVAVGIINSVINSTSYINRLGFFHILLLAQGEPCTSAGQCEGGFCCGNVCSNSACPAPAQPAGGGGVSAEAAGAGGGGGGAPPEAPAELFSDFSISPSVIKEKLALGDSKKTTIKIKNTGNTALNFFLDVKTVGNFVSVSNTSFGLYPGEEKSVEVVITGKNLGSYIGEIVAAGGGINKSANVIIDITSEQVLFDVKIDIPSDYKSVKAGSELKAQITLLNVGPAKKVRVNANYIIKGKKGEIIYEEPETFEAENQMSFVKSFRLPQNMNPGDYLAIVEIRYANSFAVSSELFSVAAPEGGIIQKAVKSTVKPKNLLAFVFAAIVISLAYAIILKSGIFESRKLKKCREAINKASAALAGNNAAKARENYIKARKYYSGLENKGKKQVYGKLMNVYRSLKNRR